MNLASLVNVLHQCLPLSHGQTDRRMDNEMTTIPLWLKQAEREKLELAFLLSNLKCTQSSQSIYLQSQYFACSAFVFLLLNCSLLLKIVLFSLVNSLQPLCMLDVEDCTTAQWQYSLFKIKVLCKTPCVVSKIISTRSQNNSQYRNSYDLYTKQINSKSLLTTM